MKSNAILVLGISIILVVLLLVAFLPRSSPSGLVGIRADVSACGERGCTAYWGATIRLIDPRTSDLVIDTELDGRVVCRGSWRVALRDGRIFDRSSFTNRK